MFTVGWVSLRKESFWLCYDQKKEVRLKTSLVLYCFSTRSRAIKSNLELASQKLENKTLRASPFFDVQRRAGITSKV